jgi:hypothetical protein
MKQVSILRDIHRELHSGMEGLAHGDMMIADHDRLLVRTCTDDAAAVDQEATVVLVAEGRINHGGEGVTARSTIHTTPFRS